MREYEQAARLRFTEAERLLSGGHFSAAIYFYGYAAEMVIVARLWMVLHPGYGMEQELSFKDVRELVKDSKAKSNMAVADRSHPVDGHANRLIKFQQECRGELEMTKLEETLVSFATTIARHWSFRLRYSSVVASEKETNEVRVAAKWILEQFPTI